MNQRTSKLINRFSTVRRLNPRIVKRAWNRTPRQKRNQMRLEMDREVEEQ